MNTDDTQVAAMLKRLRDNYFLRFAMFGALLLALSPPTDGEVLKVSTAEFGAVLDAMARQEGLERIPRQDELRYLQKYIDDELLFREAKRL